MIDVIIPAYIPSILHKELLCIALESLKNQTFKNFTVKIIFNGTDPNIVAYLPTDHRFKFFFIPEKTSAAHARNFGIRLGESKYVAQLDADDFYFPDKLNEQFNFIENNQQYDIVATLIKALKADGDYMQKPPVLYESNDEIYSIIEHENVICCGSVLFKRDSVFNKNKLFYNEFNKPDSYWPEYGRSMNEDWDLWIRCKKNNMKMFILQKELYCWRSYSSVER